MPERARLTGRSLATVRGADLARPGDPVEVVVPYGVEFRFGGISVRRASAGPLGSERWQGVRVATPHRMAFDLAARWDLPTATAHLDVVVRARLVDAAGFSRWLASRYDDDVCAVREACALIDARAESIPESRLRVVLGGAGIDVEPQVSVLHDGRCVARLDLAVRGYRLGIQYDGAWHALRSQLERDRRRLNDVQAAGWVVVHVTAEMMKDQRTLVATIRAAMDTAKPR